MGRTILQFSVFRWPSRVPTVCQWYPYEEGKRGDLDNGGLNLGTGPFLTCCCTKIQINYFAWRAPGKHRHPVVV